MKHINVLDYGKFEQTKLKDIFKLPFTEFRDVDRAICSLFNDRSEAYAIMVRTTSDGFPLLFWSNGRSSVTFFTLVTPDIAAHIERITPDSLKA